MPHTTAAVAPKCLGGNGIDTKGTDPTWSMGSDAYLLDLADHVARSSKFSTDTDICYRLTKLSALPPPSTYFGLRVALRLINIVAFAPEREDSSLPPALPDLRHRYMRLLAETDPESLALSFQKPARPGIFGGLLDTVQCSLRSVAWSALTWIHRARALELTSRRTLSAAYPFVPTTPHRQ